MCVLTQLSNKPCVSFGYAAKYIVQPIKSLRKFRLVWGRLELIRRAIAEFGIDKEEAFSATVRAPSLPRALCARARPRRSPGPTLSVTHAVCARVHARAQVCVWWRWGRMKGGGVQNHKPDARGPLRRASCRSSCRR